MAEALHRCLHHPMQVLLSDVVVGGKALNVVRADPSHVLVKRGVRVLCAVAVREEAASTAGAGPSPASLLVLAYTERAVDPASLYAHALALAAAVTPLSA
eukprot:TRINITY_DN4848_c0_g1_i1.p2 TRINITY_DN4848_c0_g1~~TRINITY_DN4848_c0_g1_i1.p2  ORF type:complete len:100 (-),score=34.56 TRINITY_DN4848_c0_g1_i1:263-562(-)